MLAEKHGTFLESLKDHKSSEFVQSVCQLAHDSTSLANHLWVRMFAELWNTFSKDQQSRLCRDLPQVSVWVVELPEVIFRADLLFGVFVDQKILVLIIVFFYDLKQETINVNYP